MNSFDKNFPVIDPQAIAETAAAKERQEIVEMIRQRIQHLNRHQYNRDNAIAADALGDFILLIIERGEKEGE